MTAIVLGLTLALHHGPRTGGEREGQQQMQGDDRPQEAAARRTRDAGTDR